MSSVAPRAASFAGPVVACVLALLSPASPALADEAGDGSGMALALDGFGTFGFVHSSERRADFAGGQLQPDGAGATREWSADVDSRLGLQLGAVFSPRLSGVVQVISEQRHDGGYTPHVEWANLQWQLSPDVELRLGRTVLASFMVSDHRKLGFANPWVRPPVELYRLVPITSSDGIDAIIRAQVGRFNHTVQASLGSTESALAQGGEIIADRVFVISDTIGWGAATLRLSYLQGDITLTPFNTLFDRFRQFGAEGIAIAERYDVDGTSAHFFGVGATYDPGDWFVTGEWALRHSHSALGRRAAWYVSGGYRWGRLTPFLTWADTRALSERTAPGLTVQDYPPQLAATARMLNATLNQALTLNPVQQTASLGLRWDLRDNVALKLQYDHSRLGDGSHGVLTNLQPGFVPGGSFDLFTVSLDFVF